ncbi:MAG: hypothetical protein ACE5GM_02000 [bacterium]
MESAKKLAAGILLLVIVLAVYLWFPLPGYRRWDGLMTASALRAWKEIPGSLIFFFAHPLVIPITKLFALVTPFKDPYFIGVFREAVFGALNALLLFWVLSRLIKRLFPAFLASLSFAFCYGNLWSVGFGEEKEVALFWVNLFLILFLICKGELEPPGFMKNKWFQKQRHHLLGILLALALATHIGNVLLIPFYLFSLLPDKKANLKQTVYQALEVLLTAGIITLIFYSFILFYVNGVRSFDGITAFFTEYQSQFFKTDYRFFKQLTSFYTGFRSLLFGPRPLGIRDFGFPAMECGVLLAFLPRVLSVSYRNNKALTRCLTVFLAVMFCYYFSWEPWSAESWLNSSFVVFMLLALFFKGNKTASGENYAWTFLLGIILLGNFLNYRAEGKRLSPALSLKASPPQHYHPLEKRLWNSTPLRKIVSKTDKLAKDHSLVLLDNRFAASYFQLYYPQTPIVIRYLDHSPEYLRGKMRLSNLSRYFYTPKLTSAQIRKAADQGERIYLLTNSPKTLRTVRWKLKLKPIQEKTIGKSRYRLYRLGK